MKPHLRLRDSRSKIFLDYDSQDVGIEQTTIPKILTFYYYGETLLRERVGVQGTKINISLVVVMKELLKLPQGET